MRRPSSCGSAHTTAAIGYSRTNSTPVMRARISSHLIINSLMCFLCVCVCTTQYFSCVSFNVHTESLHSRTLTLAHSPLTLPSHRMTEVKTLPLHARSPYFHLLNCKQPCAECETRGWRITGNERFRICDYCNKVRCVRVGVCVSLLSDLSAFVLC